jgi:hypothetical protein
VTSLLQRDGGAGGMRPENNVEKKFVRKKLSLGRPAIRPSSPAAMLKRTNSQSAMSAKKDKEQEHQKPHAGADLPYVFANVRGCLLFGLHAQE